MVNDAKVMLGACFVKSCCVRVKSSCVLVSLSHVVCLLLTPLSGKRLETLLRLSKDFFAIARVVSLQNDLIVL